MTTKEINKIARRFNDFIESKRKRSLADYEPVIDVEEKYVEFPSTFEDEDYIAGRLMITLAQLLDYKVYKYTYNAEILEIPGTYEEYAIGMSFGALDGDRFISLGNRDISNIEMGRKYARAQQIIGLAQTYEFQAFLKKNQFFFGNNDGEIEVINKRAVKVNYVGHIMHSVFKEKIISQKLLSIFNRMIKEVAIQDEPLLKQLAECVVPYGSLQKRHLSRTTVTRKGKQEIRKTIMVKAPNRSSLLLKYETQLVDDVIGKVFKDPFLQGQPSVSQNDYILRLVDLGRLHVDPTRTDNASEITETDLFAFAKGLSIVTANLKANHTVREQVLQRFSQLTTDRLKLIRKHENKPDLRKKDVTSLMVSNLIVAKQDADKSLSHHLRRFNIDNGAQLMTEFYERRLKEMKSNISFLEFIDREIESAHSLSLEKEVLEAYSFNRMTPDQQAAELEKQRKKAIKDEINRRRLEDKKDPVNAAQAAYESIEEHNLKYDHIFEYMSASGTPVKAIAKKVYRTVWDPPAELKDAVSQVKALLTLPQIKEVNRKKIMSKDAEDRIIEEIKNLQDAQLPEPLKSEENE